jgi:hypothetical protein
MKKKICFFKFDTSRAEVFLPTMWFSFKSYYEINSKYSDQWEWIPPRVDYKNWSVEEISQDLIAHNADVYAFSSYMWSWNIIRIVAEEIKKSLPNSIIVLGGPHQGVSYTDPLFWFKKYPFFDATCRPTEYGEFFILDMLDSIVENQLDWNSVRNSYHRKGVGPLGDKRSFVFPNDLLLRNLEVGLDYSDFAVKSNRVLTLPYETTRGCPYGCTYCEWGGGINSKVIAKPIEEIEKDVLYFPSLGIHTMYLCDANFGILPRDKDVAKLFAELSKTCLKHVYIGGLAKTSSIKRKLVLEPLLAAGVIDGYAMAIQAVNPQVGEIIDRVDISLEENIELADYLTSKYDLQVKVELMLGLPGVTLRDFYKEYDAFYGKYAVTRTPWFVLPDSPAANPEYIEKWQIKLVPIGLETEETDNGYISIYDQQLVQEPFYIPVGSLSYSTEDWKEMIFLNDMDVILYNRRALKPFIDFMLEFKNKPVSETFKLVYDVISKIPEFYSPIDTYLTQIVNGELYNKDWKTIPSLDMHVFKGYYYLWIQNRDKIFDNLVDLFADDLQIIDCLNYIRNTTVREDQDVSFKTIWNWKDWESGSSLKKQSIEIITLAKPIDWYTTMPRTEHSTHNSKKFDLCKYDDQIYGLKI